MYPSTSHAQDVVMRLHVAVIARNIVQERYLARLSHLAKLLQHSMDGGQRNVRMDEAYCRTDLVGVRMLLRPEQRLYDCEALAGAANPPLTTPRNELGESLNCVALMPLP